MRTKTFFIHTIGCQMNVYDAERMASRMEGLGYVPALSEANADLVVVNTCSVRDKAEQKAFSLLGRLEALKRRRPGLIIGVAGCVAQQEGARILERAPHVDIVLGTGAVDRLAEAVRKVESRRRRVLDLEMGPEAETQQPLGAAAGRGVVSRFVTIMRGCDNFCTYCVVPHVRGREASRPPERIVREVASLVARGTREVTLLGQNVNSYGRKEGLCSFAELLERVDAVEGLLRIRFTTSHPKDLTTDLVRAFGRLGKLCPHIHLPVQSGSDRILASMNRGYTRERYLDKVAELRDSCPDIAITSDIIVGFPGETTSEFEETLGLIRRVGFDGIFAFMYSDRPNTPARHMTDKVPTATQRERLHDLLGLQEALTFEKNRVLVGTVQEVLTEGLSKRPAAGEARGRPHRQWSGRTPANKIVNFSCQAPFPEDGPRAGQLVAVRIEKALAHSLRGFTADGGPGADKGKER
jgi:tRNA-2-methylthio-N6-dimethylallyladenosine synthase